MANRVLNNGLSRHFSFTQVGNGGDEKSCLYFTLQSVLERNNYNSAPVHTVIELVLVPPAASTDSSTLITKFNI